MFIHINHISAPADALDHASMRRFRAPRFSQIENEAAGDDGTSAEDPPEQPIIADRQGVICDVM